MSDNVAVQKIEAEEEELPVPVDAGAMQIATTRAAQEVQGAVLMAKRFPRDEAAAYARIMQACKRKTLAEKSTYAFPRGGKMVKGPSIRLAETLARCWGNLSCGIIELERGRGESQMQAYAWDIETNVRIERTFTVRHTRDTKGGSYDLTDERDIYERTANDGARRMRACILNAIPGDITEAALKECASTLSGGGKEPIADRIRKMVAIFEEVGVKKEMIEARLLHKTDAIVDAELGDLAAIYTSMKDGMSKREDWFQVGPPPKGPKSLDDVTDKLKAKKVEPSPDADFPPLQ